MTRALDAVGWWGELLGRLALVSGAIALVVHVCG
jgi:hypothetical protein